MQIVEIVQKCVKCSAKGMQHFSITFLDCEVHKVHTNTFQEVLEAYLCREVHAVRSPYIYAAHMFFYPRSWKILYKI